MAAAVGVQSLLAGVLLAVGVTPALAGCEAASSGASSSGSPSTAQRAFDVVATYTAKSLGLRRPTALALGPDGDLYVTDNSQRVSVISPTGRVVRRWGEPGDGPGQFHFISTDPSDPTVLMQRLTVGPDGSVYVSDSGNARVQVFTPEGRFVRQFGSYGHADNQFLRPFDLAVDDSGDVFVADDEHQTLKRFSPTGTAVWVIGGALNDDDDLVGHFHLSMIDRHGRLLVTNDDKGRILYVDANGHKVDAFGGSGPLMRDGPCDITVDDLGYTYVSPCGPGSTYVYDRSHRQVASFPASEGVLIAAPRFSANDTGYALGIDGSLIVVRATLGRS